MHLYVQFTDDFYGLLTRFEKEFNFFFFIYIINI